jgi:hypothetical protein
MASKLGHDIIGYTLWVQCDGCKEQIMCFSDKTDRLPELEAINRQLLEQMAQTECGYRHLGGGNWLCQRCESANSEQT